MEKLACENCGYNPCADCKEEICSHCTFSQERRQACNFPCGQQNCWFDLYEIEE